MPAVIDTARRVNVMVCCLSVCLFAPAIDQHFNACRLQACITENHHGGFAAVGPAGRRYQSIAARPAAAQQQRRHSSTCGQCHVTSRRRWLNTDLFETNLSLGGFMHTVPLAWQILVNFVMNKSQWLSQGRQLPPGQRQIIIVVSVVRTAELDC